MVVGEGELQRLDTKCVHTTSSALPAWCWMQLEVINILILHSEEYSVFKAGLLPMNFTSYYCLLQVSRHLPGRTVSDTAVSHIPQLLSKQEVKLKNRDS